MIDIIDHAAEEKLQVVNLSLDFEKAFDRVEHCTLEATLKYFNFGEKIIEWIMLLYTQFYECTSNSGEISEWFLLTKGLYQGNPLSSTVFILIVKIVVHVIRQNTKIKGIMIGQHEFKIAQFADDSNLFLLFEQETLQEAIETLTVFEKNSGLKLNYDLRLMSN